MISVAHSAGYQFAGLRLMAAWPGALPYPLMDDVALLRETMARISDTGVRIFDLEVIRIGVPFDAADYERFFEAGAKLGGKVVAVMSDDADEERVAASFAALCEAARPYGLSMNLEFIPFTGVRNAASAVRIVSNANASNGSVLVDALHFIRSDTSIADIVGIPRSMLTFAQICDAPAEAPKTLEDLLHMVRFERLLPGEGGIDLVNLFAALPETLPIGIEIPNVRRAAIVGYETWARQALSAAKTSVAAAALARHQEKSCQ
jgi:sugar phosphate isomerase/epimerase